MRHLEKLHRLSLAGLKQDTANKLGRSLAWLLDNIERFEPLPDGQNRSLQEKAFAELCLLLWLLIRIPDLAQGVLPFLPYVSRYAARPFFREQLQRHAGSFSPSMFVHLLLEAADLPSPICTDAYILSWLTDRALLSERAPYRDMEIRFVADALSIESSLLPRYHHLWPHTTLGRYVNRYPDVQVLMQPARSATCKGVMR